MTINEKAQRYDEALKVAKDIRNGEATYIPNGTPVIEAIFPELKESEESENERIRQDIIWCFKHSGIKDNKPINPHVTTIIKDAIAWLEKQRMSYTKKDVDDAYLKGVADTKDEIEKQYEATYQIRKDIATFIFNYKGDIKDRAKWIDYLGIKVSFVEKQGKQETLCDKCRKEHPSHSCQDITALGRCAVEYEQKSINEVKPFNEYEGLTDFERTLADICIGWIGQELGWKPYIKDNADILLKIAIKKFNSIQDAPFEQKPAWSEEDENMLKLVIKSCEQCGNEYAYYWLKFLKNRVQPKQNKL